MTECWRDELRRHDVRVILCNPSEVLDGLLTAGRGEPAGFPKKLIPEDIAEAVTGSCAPTPGASSLSSRCSRPIRSEEEIGARLRPADLAGGLA